MKRKQKFGKDKENKPTDTLEAKIESLTANNKPDEEFPNKLLEPYKQVYSQYPHSIIMTDTNFNIIYTNNQTTKLFGYKASELIGLKLNILIADDPKPDFQNQIFQYLSNKKIWTGIIKHNKKNNTVFDCKLTVFPIQELDEIIGYAGILEDVTSQIKDQSEYVKTTHKFGNLKEHCYGIYWELDHEFRIIYVNSSIIPILHYQPFDVLGKDFFSLLSPDTINTSTINILTQIKTNKTIHFENTFLSGTDKPIILESELIPIYETTIKYQNDSTTKNQIIGYQCISHDITKKKETAMCK